MWIVAGVLLGAVVLAGLLGFHAGPHVHLVAGALGVVAAGWLILMAVAGRGLPVLWVLLSADAAISAGLGVMGVTGLRHRNVQSRYRVGRLEAAEGVAVSDLVPEGIVRVRGEDWSAVCVNGPVRAGTRIQVLREGVRLEVWGERSEATEETHETAEEAVVGPGLDGPDGSHGTTHGTTQASTAQRGSAQHMDSMEGKEQTKERSA